MRLLSFDADGKLRITRDLDDNVKPYAILSHTWGEDKDEVEFSEVDSTSCLTKVGYKKIELCGRQAQRDGWQYFWVDTCCIDKPNHTELSTAIRSMYQWYQHAEVCYVYLADVSSQSDGHDRSTDRNWEPNFRKSRWFTRGWTLQELLAPREVVFYSKEWNHLGTRSELKELLHDITGIPISALDGQALSSFTVDERMQWTQNRQTKKTEDQAYCLLGIFGVFMCLKYGEGDNAFRRLRKKIKSQCVENGNAFDLMEKTRSHDLYLTSTPSSQPETSVGHIELSDQLLQALIRSRPNIIAAPEQQRLKLFLRQAQQTEPEVPTDDSRQPQRSDRPSSKTQRSFAREQPQSRTMQHRKSACQKGTCSCHCHQSRMQQSLSLTSLSPAKFLIRCQCQSKDFRFRVSFLQRVVSVALGIDWTQGMRLNGSLHVQATVKYTSPGFLVVAKCFHGLLSFEQARRDLCALRDENLIDFTDISPDGDGVLEKVILRPWEKLTQLQFQLVEFLMKEGALRNSERLLEIVLDWVGNGPYVSLLEILVKHSLDASDITSSLFSKWPRTARSRWLSPFCWDDPFYLRSIALLTASDAEFGGTTALQAAILQNDRLLVAKLGKQTNPLSADRNFLSQSILHLAVLNSSMLAHVLHVFDDIDVDARDARGTTPLMYAMSYGAIDSACLLLRAGADPFCPDSLNNFSAWTYALIRADMELLVATIDTYSSFGPEHASKAVKFCLWTRILNEDASFNDADRGILSYLLKPSIGHDLTLSDGSTLLHMCCHTDAKLLVRTKTIPVNQQNKHGHTPLMKISRFRDPTFILALIHQGATTDLLDNSRKNALHHLMSHMIAVSLWDRDLEQYPPAMASAAALLCHKGKLIHGDDCYCLCSLSGCTPLAYLFASSHWPKPQSKNIKFALLLLEYLLMMQNWRPLEIQIALEALFRRQRFDELGMTHTCCQSWDADSDWLSSSFDDTSFAGSECDEQYRTGTSSTSEQEIDAEEIRDEEKEFARILQEDCDNFLITGFGDVEEAWIYVLSRRVVMMEEALWDARKERNNQRAKIGPEKPQQRKVPEVDGEIIMLSPLTYVSHRTGDIVQPNRIMAAYVPSYSDINLENSVDEYLSAFEEHTHSISFMQDTIGVDQDRWKTRRRELTSKLLQSAVRLREAPKEQRDWNMNVDENMLHRLW